MVSISQKHKSKFSDYQIVYLRLGKGLGLGTLQELAVRRYGRQHRINLVEEITPAVLFPGVLRRQIEEHFRIFLLRGCQVN